MANRLKLPAVLVLAGVLGLAASQPAPGDEAEDRKALEGVWVGFVAEPRSERPGPIRFSEIRIGPEKITGKGQDGKDMGEGTYRLGHAGGLRTLDTVGTAGEPRGQSFLGIYEVKGDTLRWCSANPGKPRPTEFTTRVGTQWMMILTRKK